MKTKRFRLLTVLLTAVMLVALSLNVMAAKGNAVTQDGLTAQLFTDKDSYKAGESVKASVQVDNHTGKEVFIFTQINVPEGVTLASESAAFDVTLRDGESWTTPGGITLSAGGVTTAGAAATGDNMQAGFYVILTALAVCGIMALLVYGKNRKTWLSILLCLAMVGGMVVAAVPVQAADMNGDIQLSCAIQVDGKDTELSATVSYVIYDEAEEAAEESTEVVIPSEPSEESSDSSDVTDGSDVTEDSDTTDGSDTTEDSDATDSSDTTEDSDATDSSDTAEDSNTSDASDTTEDSNTDSSDATDGSDTTEDSDTSDSSDTTEDSSTDTDSDTDSDSDATEDSNTSDSDDTTDDSDESNGSDGSEDVANLIADYTIVHSNNEDVVKEIICEVKKGNYPTNPKDAKATVEYLDGEGYTSEDGCVHYDIEYSGDAINVFQVYCDLENVLKEGNVYKVGFWAKLVEKNPTDTNQSIPVNVCKFRHITDNNTNYSNIVGPFNITEGTGEWTLYECELTATSTQELARLLFQIGGGKTSNVELYLDDFFVIDMKSGVDITVNIDGASEGEVVAISENVEGSEFVFYAASNPKAGVLLDSWVDGYGNKVSADSYFVTNLSASEEYSAVFGEYVLNDNEIGVPASESLSLTVEKPVINGSSVTANATVSAPSNWTVMESGVIFYPGYWTENFNVFSEKISKSTVETVNNGAFSAITEMETKYGVLAKAYAIAKNTDGMLVIQYSDSAYTEATTSTKTAYKTVTYLEALQIFGGEEDAGSPEKYGAYVDSIAKSGTDMISFCPTLYKLNAWKSDVDTWWSTLEERELDTTSDLYHFVAQCMNYILEKNGDPVQDVIDACRAADVAVFMDYRMNDNHRNEDINTPTHPPFWYENEEYWTDGMKRYFNYMYPEVQDYYFAMLEEFMTRYDVDGLNLDFDRYRAYFALGEEERGSAVLTEFIGRVKEMVNKISVEENREIQLAVRVPETVETANSLGMDVATWDELGYCDIVYVGAHYSNTQQPDIQGYDDILSESTNLIGIVHYLTKETAISGTKYRRFITSQEAYATAKSWLSQGAEGIFWWNMQYLPDPDAFYPLLKVATDDEALAKAEKNYVLTHHDLQSTYGTEQKTSIYIDEDTSNFAAAYMRVEASGIFNDETVITVTFNGQTLNEVSYDDTEFFDVYENNRSLYADSNAVKFFEIPMGVFAKGENEIIIKNVTGYETCSYIDGIQIAFFNEELENVGDVYDPTGSYSVSPDNMITSSVNASIKGGTTTTHPEWTYPDARVSTTTDGYIYYDINNSGDGWTNSFQLTYDGGALPAGTYKAGFWAKLTEKEPTDTNQTLAVNLLKLRKTDDNNTNYSNLIKNVTITEGTGSWTYYEYTLEVSEPQDTYRMLIQMGGDNKENLDLYMAGFFLVPVCDLTGSYSVSPDNMITSSVNASIKGGTTTTHPEWTYPDARVSTTTDGYIYYDINNSGDGWTNSFQLTYDGGALPAGTYKAGFWAKLTEKEPTDTNQTLAVNLLKLRKTDDNNTNYSNLIKNVTITEGTGSWTYYEYTLEVSEPQDTYRMLIQMGGDNKENLDLYMTGFFLVPVENE